MPLPHYPTRPQWAPFQGLPNGSDQYCPLHSPIPLVKLWTDPGDSDWKVRHHQGTVNSPTWNAASPTALAARLSKQQLSWAQEEAGCVQGLQRVPNGKPTTCMWNCWWNWLLLQGPNCQITRNNQEDQQRHEPNFNIESCNHKNTTIQTNIRNSHHNNWHNNNEFRGPCGRQELEKEPTIRMPEGNQNGVRIDIWTCPKHDVRTKVVMFCILPSILKLVLGILTYTRTERVPASRAANSNSRPSVRNNNSVRTFLPTCTEQTHEKPWGNFMRAWMDPFMEKQCNTCEKTQDNVISDATSPWPLTFWKASRPREVTLSAVDHAL